MIVEEIPGPPYDKTQCELPAEDLAPAATYWKGYREKRAKWSEADPKTCMRHARWIVDGRKLCTQHAGMLALNHLKCN